LELGDIIICRVRQLEYLAVHERQAAAADEGYYSLFYG
jgi:hypothetical protein